VSSVPAAAVDRQPVPPRRRSAASRAAGEAERPEWLRTQRQLRRAAARLIGERGLLKATPRAIVQAARLPELALTECYASREALIADIVLRHLDALTCWILAARDAATVEGPAAQLDAMVGAYLASSLAERDEHRMLLRLADVLPPREKEQVRLRCRGLVALFAETLDETVAEATEATARVAALTLLGGLSCAVLWFDPDGSVGFAAYARMALAMALQGARSAAGSSAATSTLFVL
jgi:AcrR family transcriptional regulator